MGAITIRSHRVVIWDKNNELFFPENHVYFATEDEATSHSADIRKKFERIVGSINIAGSEREPTHVYIADFGAVALDGVYHTRHRMATGDVIYVVQIPSEKRVTVLLMQDLELPPGEGQVLRFGEPLVRVVTEDSGRHLNRTEAAHLVVMLEHADEIILNRLARRTGHTPDEAADLA